MKRVLLAVAMFATLVSATLVQAEELALSAGAPLFNLVDPLKTAYEKATGIKIQVLYGSATLVFKQLSRGEAEIACLGDSFEGIQATLKKDGVEVADVAAFQPVTISKGRIYTIVNKANPVTKLSKEQLKGIFTGRLTNWKEVGGNDAPIIVVISTTTPATNSVFSRSILDNEPFLKDQLELGRMDEVRGGVENNPEAIAFGAVTVLGPEVRQVTTPEIFRPIILLTKGQPSPKAGKFIDFVVSGPGKGLIKE